MLFPNIRQTGWALVLAGSLAMPAYAQTQAPAQPSPEHLALARAVLDFTGAGSSFDSIVPRLLQDARNVILRTRPMLQPDLDPIITSLTTKLSSRDDELLNEIAKVYATKFTENELKDIAKFYQSPVGQKMTGALPEILRESFGFAQEWSQRVSVEVMNEIRAEMSKKGHDM
ncbi:DUF2059 domain-containing protein [Terrihabitans sp. B22-R8]|uniref:DUF2059 domain-containing protein n=1 Tax=Terrihabitans sp. B22-R8 TaxID=3425128 RepID=UPI00403C2359